MKNQPGNFNYFWWDGGFESVNSAESTLNPQGIAHFLTPVYRLDVSRFQNMLKGISLVNDSETTCMLHGSQLPLPDIAFHQSLTASYDGTALHVNSDTERERALMVYDAGSICNHVRIKYVDLLDSNDKKCDGLDVETAIWNWQDCIAVSVAVLDDATRLPATKTESMSLQINIEDASLEADTDCIYLTRGNKREFAVLSGPGTSLSCNENQIVLTGKSHQLAYQIVPITAPDTIEKHLLQQSLDVRALDTQNDVVYNVEFDPVCCAFKIDMDNYDGLKEANINIQVNSDRSKEIPCRLLLNREGKPRLLPDGSVLPMNESGVFKQIASFPVGFDKDGAPSGQTWQVSTDSHEFENHPRPYPQRWLHLYTQFTCCQSSPINETVKLAWATFGEKPAAQFCQLSLLGWDDNPKYGGDRNYKKVQLWCQGLINHQEILCICPESHMTNSTLTDIRPVDQKNAWGPNNGGGDFLRYRFGEENQLRRMRAARCHFENYGPNLGTLKMHMTSTEDAIIADIDSHMMAGNDFSRIYFEADYRVQKEISVKELIFIWLGCPTYDFTRYARFAYGQYDTVIEDGKLTAAQNLSFEKLLPDTIEEGYWFSSYRGGVIDEQHREPNGNKGLVYRGGSISIKNHPDCKLQAKQVVLSPYRGPTTQYWLGIFANENETINLSPGDRIRLSWEYVPTLKYVTDYGLVDHNPVYLKLLRDFPDSTIPLQYVAKHGKWITDNDNSSFFPTVTMEDQRVEFDLTGGSGWTPIRILSSEKPEPLILEEFIDGNWVNCTPEANFRLPYQLHFDGTNWVATFLVKGQAESLEAAPIKRHFKVSHK